MKYCVTTQYIGEDYKKIAQFTLPLMKEYADYIGADFKLTEITNLNYPRLTHNNLNVFNLLKEYDYVVFFDIDCLVRPTMRNIFEEYSDCTIALKPYRSDRIEDALIGQRGQIQKYLQLSNTNFSILRQEYYNTGVILLRSDAYDYRYSNICPWSYPLEDEIFLNHLVYQTDINFKVLDKYYHYVFHIDNERDIAGWSNTYLKERCQFYITKLNRDIYNVGVSHFSIKPKQITFLNLIKKVYDTILGNSFRYDYLDELIIHMDEYIRSNSISNINNIIKRLEN